jgi:hypothetical protein
MLLSIHIREERRETGYILTLAEEKLADRVPQYHQFTPYLPEVMLISAVT